MTTQTNVDRVADLVLSLGAHIWAMLLPAIREELGDGWAHYGRAVADLERFRETWVEAQDARDRFRDERDSWRRTAERLERSVADMRDALGLSQREECERVAEELRDQIEWGRVRGEANAERADDVATALEESRAEIERLTRERDAAIEDWAQAAAGRDEQRDPDISAANDHLIRAEGAALHLTAEALRDKWLDNEHPAVCKWCDGRGCRHCDCKLCGCGVCSCCNGRCSCQEREATP